MTKEDIAILEKWEETFQLAIKANFVRMSAREFGEFAKDYNKFHTPLTTSQMNCNTCRLRAITLLGNEYFKAKNDIAIMEMEERTKNAEENNKKKVGRPRKIKMED